MKFFISFYFVIMTNFLCANLISIYHAPNERQEAHWVKSILIKNGIPLDYIELKITYKNCLYEMPDKYALMKLCIDHQKQLKTLQFDRKKFFWQLGPLIESN